jgi:hypothetical protein
MQSVGMVMKAAVNCNSQKMSFSLLLINKGKQRVWVYDLNLAPSTKSELKTKGEVLHDGAVFTSA